MGSWRECDRSRPIHRTYFPTFVVKVMHNKTPSSASTCASMLLEPEMLQAVEPDVYLVANLLAFSGVMPSKTKETAQMVVRRVVEELQ